MVKINESWIIQQESAHHSPCLKLMSTLLPSAPPNIFPSCMNSYVSTANLALPGFPFSALHEARTAQSTGADEASPCLPSMEGSSLPIPNSSLKECQYSFASGIGMKPSPNDFTGRMQKSFLIFDQSRNETRMFFSSLNPSFKNHFIETTTHPFACPLSEKVLAENHVIGDEGSEMHEDTEDINALLYSDDEDSEYDDGEDDEVTSTYHSPFLLKRINDNSEQVEAKSDGFATFDGSTKRQKLLDGGYQRSVEIAVTSGKLDRSRDYQNDAESCCVSASVKDIGSIVDEKKMRRNQIRETLKILECIIPGSIHKDPLLIIDEAISHLKSLKLKAKALGICCSP